MVSSHGQLKDPRRDLLCDIYSGLLFTWTVDIVSTSSSCLKHILTTVGVSHVMTKHIAKGIGITLCTMRNFILNTTSKSSKLTTTKSILPFQAPALSDTHRATPKTERVVELTAFIFLVSLDHCKFNRQASTSINKLLVNPKSTIVLFVGF